MSRYYWFLSQWHWYELVWAGGSTGDSGNVAKHGRSDADEATARCALAQMGLVDRNDRNASRRLLRATWIRDAPGGTPATAADLSTGVHRDDSVCGRVPGPMDGRAVGAGSEYLALLAVVMFVAERQTFPASAHLEFLRCPEQAARECVGAGISSG